LKSPTSASPFPSSYPSSVDNQSLVHRPSIHIHRFFPPNPNNRLNRSIHPPTHPPTDLPTTAPTRPPPPPPTDGADAVCHGATGKGNDQVRFELGYYALKPDVKVIAPWREWDLNSRTKLLAYAEKAGIPIPEAKRGEPPLSMDANLLHISYEGNALEDPWVEAGDIYTRSVSPEEAPDTAQYVEIEFEKARGCVGGVCLSVGRPPFLVFLSLCLWLSIHPSVIPSIHQFLPFRLSNHPSHTVPTVRSTPQGDPVAIDGVKLSPADLLAKLNTLGGAHGIGRKDIVESRFVGMKSRGVYETPGGTILHEAHIGMESITLDRGEMHLRDELTPRYAELVYNGLWFSPEREALQAFVDCTQRYVTGTVRVKLFKGSVQVVGRRSPYSLYDQDIVTFEEDSVYDQARGWSRLGASTSGGRTFRPRVVRLFQFLLPVSTSLCPSIPSVTSIPSRPHHSFHSVHQKDAGGFIKIQALRLRTLATSRGYGKK